MNPGVRLVQRYEILCFNSNELLMSWCQVLVILAGHFPDASPGGIYPKDYWLISFLFVLFSFLRCWSPPYHLSPIRHCKQKILNIFLHNISHSFQLHNVKMRNDFIFSSTLISSVFMFGNILHWNALACTILAVVSMTMLLSTVIYVFS